jgi:uncharacterized protein GlcG (DUF336 family)
VDASGTLIAHIRMDGARLGAVDIAIDKAWTAQAFEMSTEDLARAAQSGASVFGINSTNHSRVVIFGGGIPVLIGGVVVGGVGASGGTVDQDIRIARAAIAEFEGGH